MKRNNNRRSQQARSGSADRHTPSSGPYSNQGQWDENDDIFRYDARIQAPGFVLDDLENEVGLEMHYEDLDGELEYEDDGDYLDSQGVQPASEPKASPKSYRKRVPNSRPPARPAPPAARQSHYTKAQTDWQENDQFDEFEDDDFTEDPIFGQIQVHDQAAYEADADYGADYGVEYVQSQTARRPSPLKKLEPVQVILGVIAVLFVGILLMSRPLTAGVIDRMARNASEAKAFGPQTNAVSTGGSSGQIVATQLSPFFAQSVLYWEADILQWAATHNMNPNMVATIMQIESCGDPRAVSSAGAMGLFQVMPFHFEAGEDGFDPNINALRGMNYLAARLIQTEGDIGRAFAGYNGGHVAAASGWNSWANETQRYYTWTTGVYGDALNGDRRSNTLDQWMAAGGASLCAQAEQRLGLQ